MGRDATLLLVSSGPSDTAGSGGSHNSSVSGNYTGAIAQTMWGPVQVEIIVKNGRVTAVNLMQYPNGNHRDAQIKMVSGATVTSGGYLQSLQSALDHAGI